jgi:prephenate dehydrogenase
MWRDIALMNREGILELTDFFSDYLANLRSLVERGDAKGLEEFFARSKERRDAIQ